MKYSLVTKYTSFVAVFEKEATKENNEEEESESEEMKYESSTMPTDGKELDGEFYDEKASYSGIGGASSGKTLFVRIGFIFLLYFFSILI